MSELINQINKIPKNYFSLNDLKKISPIKEASLKVSLSRLVKNGKLAKLGNKLYTLDALKIDLDKLACEIYAPSYISFETALGYHNILSQQSLHLTLATPKRSRIIGILNKNLIYHHLKKGLFWGYQKIDNIFLAEAEKAFLDQAYLSLNGYAKFDPEEMNLDLLDKNKIKKYCQRFKNQRLTKLIRGRDLSNLKK
ncbi:MAG: hypothetical protein ABIJ91_02610 [Candidatus Kuenenbacteria bacterium]